LLLQQEENDPKIHQRLEAQKRSFEQHKEVGIYIDVCMEGNVITTVVV
jgi:hypothetical protein